MQDIYASNENNLFNLLRKTSNFKIKIQTLYFIFQAFNESKSLTDRFYRALYELVIFFHPTCRCWTPRSRGPNCRSCSSICCSSPWNRIALCRDKKLISRGCFKYISCLTHRWPHRRAQHSRLLAWCSPPRYWIKWRDYNPCWCNRKTSSRMMRRNSMWMLIRSRWPRWRSRRMLGTTPSNVTPSIVKLKPPRCGSYIPSWRASTPRLCL